MNTTTRNGTKPHAKPTTNGTPKKTPPPAKKIFYHPSVPGGEERRKFTHEKNDPQAISTVEALYGALDEIGNWHTCGHHGPSCCCRLCGQFRALHFFVDQTIIDVENEMIAGNEERPIHRVRRGKDSPN